MKRQVKDITSGIAAVLLILIVIGAISSLLLERDSNDTPNRDEHTSRVVIDSETPTEILDESTNAGDGPSIGENESTPDGGIDLPGMDF